MSNLPVAIVAAQRTLKSSQPFLLGHSEARDRTRLLDGAVLSPAGVSELRTGGEFLVQAHACGRSPLLSVP